MSRNLGIKIRNTLEVIIDTTKSWIEKVVIGLNFCPFAVMPFKEGSIRYVVSEGKGLQSALQQFARELMYLDDNQTTSTTLIIFPDEFGDFYKYLELVDLCEQLLEKEGYEGVYQVASFHPLYQFSGTTDTDPTNYTNRSPYPMLHLLREESITLAVKKHVNIDEVPERNMQKARELGIDFFKDLEF